MLCCRGNCNPLAPNQGLGTRTVLTLTNGNESSKPGGQNTRQGGRRVPEALPPASRALGHSGAGDPAPVPALDSKIHFLCMEEVTGNRKLQKPSCSPVRTCGAWAARPFALEPAL